MLKYFLYGSVKELNFVGGSEKWVLLTFGMQLGGCGMSFQTQSQENLEMSKINVMHLSNVC